MGTSVVRFESRTVVRRPAPEVFECLTDLPGYGRWMHRDGVFGRVELTSPPPVRSGTTYVDHTRMGAFVGEVIVHDPASRLAFRETLCWFGRPVVQARPSYAFEPFADGATDRTIDGATDRAIDCGWTVVHHTAEAELYGPMRLFRRAVAWMVSRERTRTLVSLERALAAEDPQRTG